MMTLLMACVLMEMRAFGFFASFTVHLLKLPKSTKSRWVDAREYGLVETAIEKGTTSAAEKGTRSAIEKGTT